MFQTTQERVIKRVAFPLIGGRVGSGSYNYLLNLVRALDSQPLQLLSPVIFAGTDLTTEELAPFADSASAEIVQSAEFDRRRSTTRLGQALLMGVDSIAASAFKRVDIDVAFEPATFYGWRFPVPTIAWMPDFQHRHLKHLFDFFDYWRRDLGFKLQVASKRVLMLSSEDARRDCEQFYPSARGRTSVVNFAVQVDRDLLSTSPAAVVKEYGLPTRFFYLPNQFWKHKNHSLVIEATRLLKQRGSNVVVAASGRQEDPRDPHHYLNLRKLVEALGLTDSFRFLGLIPRSHVIALLRACTALINPSRFEGWSTPVEEARSLGVPMLLSNLPVHREQMGDLASYFDVDSPEQLATLMVQKAAQTDSERRMAERAALDSGRDRVRKYCADFLQTVEQALKS